MSALEQAAGVGIGQHDRGDIGTELGLQRSGVDTAVVLGRDFVDREACQRRGCRIGAVGGFRHQDARALLAARLERGPDGQQAAQFAMRAGLGAHRHGRHAGQYRQPAHQFADQRQRALHRLLRLQRMEIAKARQPRHLLVEPRIVLHRAGAERIKPRIDRVIHARQPHVMAHHFRLGQARQADRRFGAARRRACVSDNCTSGRSTPVTPARPNSKISFSSWSRPRSPEIVRDFLCHSPACPARASLMVHHAAPPRAPARRRRNLHQLRFRWRRRSEDRAHARSCGISREAGTPAMMPLAASASTTAPQVSAVSA